MTPTAAGAISPWIRSPSGRGVSFTELWSLGETEPGQVLSHPGCQQQWNLVPVSAIKLFLWQQSLRRNLFCEMCRLGLSVYSSCLDLNSATSTSVRPLSQVLADGHERWPEPPRREAALAPPRAPATATLVVPEPVLPGPSVHHGLYMSNPAG